MKKIAIFFIYFIVSQTTLFAQWYNISQNDTTIDLFKILFTDSDTGFAVGRKYASWIPAYPPYDQYVDSLMVDPEGILLRTFNGGETWDTIFYPEFYVFEGIHFPTKDTGYICGTPNNPSLQTHFLKTTDGGNSWFEMQLPIFGTYCAVYFVDGYRGCIASRNHASFRTSDGGNSWTLITTINNSVNDITFVNHDIGFTSGGEKTIDSGTNWSFVGSSFSANVTNAILAIEYINEDIGFSGGASSTYGWTGAIAKTYNSGYNWNLIFEHSTPVFDIEAIDDSVIFFAGGGIYKTLDQGNTIYSQKININNIDSISCVYSVSFPDSNIGYAACPGGMILKTEDGGGALYPLLNSSTQVSSFKFTLYPNPSSTVLNIEFSEQIAGTKTLEVYNLSGQKVLSRLLEDTGSYRLDVSQLPQGNYLLKLLGNDEVFVRKFVIIR